MDDMRITVLMTVYNGGHFLKMAIESVLSQTYKDFEFLIVEDHSTDDSLKLIESFNDERLVVHANENNIGQTASLNVGLKLARGRYVARIDADDVAFPDWLEVQVAYIKENPGHAVVSANTLVIDENNKIIRDFVCPTSLSDMRLRSILASPISHGVALIDKEIALASGGYDEKHKIIADYGLWSKMIRGGHRFASSNRYLMAIRMHSTRSSVVSGNDIYLDQFVLVMKDNIESIAKNSFSDEEVAVLAKACYSTDLLNDDEFKEAVDILEKIYKNVNPALDVNSCNLSKWLQKQRLSLYYKRIYFYISRGESAKVKQVALEGMGCSGKDKNLLICYVASFFGMFFLKMIPAVHEKLSRQRTLFQLRGSYDSNRFH